MNFIAKRIGLALYALLSIVESLINLILYLTFLDKIIKPIDWAFPFYFTYTDKILKNHYLNSLKKDHGEDT